MLFSIITVCWNSEKTISDTLESVLSQDFDDYEYIIIDGDSSDNTMNIINEYKGRFKDKLKVVSEPDEGLYYAMNKGIQMCTGELIGIINSDDWYEKNTLSTVYSNYKGNKYEVIYGKLRIVDGIDEKGVVFVKHDCLKKNMIAHPTCFVTRSTYEEFGGFDTRYKISADYDLMLRFYLNKKVVFTPCCSILANFRQGGASNSPLAFWEPVLVRYRYGLEKKNNYYKTLFLMKIYSIKKDIKKLFGR